MIKYVAYAMSAVLLMGCQSLSKTDKPKTTPHKKAQDTAKQSQTLIVWYDKAFENQILTAIHQDKNLVMIYHYQQLNGLAVKVNDGNLQKATQTLQQLEGVLGVHRDEAMQLHQ